MMPLRVQVKESQCMHNCEEAVADLSSLRPKQAEPGQFKKCHAEAAENLALRRQPLTATTQCKPFRGETRKSPGMYSQARTAADQLSLHLVATAAALNLLLQAQMETALELHALLQTKMDQAWPWYAKKEETRTAPGPELEAPSPVWPDHGATRTVQGWSC